MSKIQSYKNRPTILFNKWQSRSLRTLITILKLAKTEGLIQKKDFLSLEQNFENRQNENLKQLQTQTIQKLLELICDKHLEELLPGYRSEAAQIALLREIQNKRLPENWNILREKLIDWIENDQSKFMFFHQGRHYASRHQHGEQKQIKIHYLPLLSHLNLELRELIPTKSLLRVIYLASTGRKPLVDVWRSRSRRKALSIYRRTVINAFASYEEFHKTMDSYYDLCGSLSEGQIERRASHYHAGYSDKEFNFQADFQQYPVPDAPKPPQSIVRLQMLAEARFQREYKKNYE